MYMMKRDIIYHTDCLSLIHDGLIDKGCAKMVITDPPYNQDAIDLYRHAAILAEHCLCPGGWLFALGGVSYLPWQLDNIQRVDGLEYFATFIIEHRGGFPRIWTRRLLSAYKPVYVFTKGPYPSVIPWQSTALGGEKDKRFHKWGQGARPFFKWIDMLSEPGDLIVDPFCGGGTVCAVAKTLNRFYIGCDIDREVVDGARARLAETMVQENFGWNARDDEIGKQTHLREAPDAIQEDWQEGL